MQAHNPAPSFYHHDLSDLQLQSFMIDMIYNININKTTMNQLRRGVNIYPLLSNFEPFISAVSDCHLTHCFITSPCVLDFFHGILSVSVYVYFRQVLCRSKNGKVTF